ncbi:hypothetical protein ACHAWO_008758 [Cyclotella atomus]|uniref:Peptidase C14 caspase domain-containing protein n=1 Tax=Cyclotella atomus TaxID=382360 RepID=A0ABD3QLL0_9STRA
MHYACIIGVNHEWPEQRKELGDIGLARCLRDHCQIPKERLLEIYDQRATRSRVLYSLEALLNTRNQNATDDDVLLLYYGGHGKREEACTFTESIVDGKVQKEPWLRYSEIVDLLESHFRGGTVWVIVDCCHSGGLGEAVVEQFHKSKKLNANYGCILSVPPWDEAGMEWTMSECFIRAFKGELFSAISDSAPYYLSTKKGKHRIKTRDEVYLVNGGTTLQQTATPTWEQVIDFLSDEMARIKGDQLTTLFFGERMSTYLQMQCSFGDHSTADEVQSCQNIKLHKIPRDISWIEAFASSELSVNDEVYIKYIGSVGGANELLDDADSDLCSNTIGWLPGRIVTTIDNIACIQVNHGISETCWTVKVPMTNSSSSAIMCGLPFGFHLDPQHCVAAITNLAKQLCYIDTSLRPFTRLRILWSDGELYFGRVMSHTEINWAHVNDHEVDDKYNVVGGYVAVQWEGEDTTSLVPLEKCFLVDQTKQNLDNVDLMSTQEANGKPIKHVPARIETPMDAVVASFSCSGKKLHSEDVPLVNNVELNKQSCCEWDAYDAEDKAYLPVQVLNGCIKKLPLEVMAHHLLYPQSGNFSVVYWEEDSVLSLLPSTFLRLRSNLDDSGSESSESSESSSKDSECIELKRNSDESTFNDNPWCSSPQITQLGLFAISFSIGYLFGKRTKPS